MKIPGAARVSLATGGFAVTVGGAVLAGWALDIGALKSVLPGLNSMKANTAICFMLVGAALWALRRGAPGSRATLVASVCAWLVVAIASLSLAEMVFSLDLRIDQAIFRDPLPPGSAEAPGRMAPATAFAFIMLGAALLLAGRGPALVVSQLLAALAGLLGLLAAIGYVYGAQPLYNPGNYIRMALHTAMCFLAVSAGVLALWADRGLMTILTAERFGSLVARRLLPVVIVLPIVLGWLRLKGEAMALFGPSEGVALVVTVMIIILTVLIVWTAASLNRLEAEHEESEQRFQATFEQAAAGIAHVAPDGSWLHVNQKLCDIVGYTRDELLRLTFQDITHPDDLDTDLAHLRQMLAGETTYYCMEKRYFHKDGRVVWINLTVSLVRDALGAPSYFISVIQDISLRKRAEAELQMLYAELEQRVASRTADLQAANKELDAFAYSVSHDLRAPLRHIDAFSDLLMRRAPSGLDEKSSRYLQNISESARQLGTLIDELLVFSRTGRSEMKKSLVAPAALLEQVLDELRPDMEGRTIDWEIGELPEVHADPTMLRLVLMNLLDNAIKFTAPRPCGTIAIGSAASDPDEQVFFVRDNGVGFDMKYVHKLFGVFQRLHSAAEFPGTGIGLANVQRIIQRHGGRTWAEGAVDRGATIYFSLPRYQKGQRDGRP